MKHTDARSLSAEAQEALRRRAVRAVRDGRSQAEVARTFGVSRQSVVKWCRGFVKGGAQALTAGKKGRPPGRHLTPVRQSRIARLVVDRCPEQLKLPFYLWTREAVGLLIRREYGVEVSVWTVGRYLREWGFTPQKPLRRAFEQDPEAVRRWLAREYPAIRARARREGAEIHWGDEMGLRSDHQAGRSYGLRGHTPVIPGTGQRFRCNMISTVTNRGRLAFMVFRECFTARVFLKFLGRLVRQTGRPVFLILDGHPVHKSRIAKRWLAEHATQIQLFLLPAYSPQLNPDELLNQDVKTNAVGRERPHDLGEMVGRVRSYLRGTQRRPHIVRNYFKEEHVRYAAG